jgi:hypothetical protein
MQPQGGTASPLLMFPSRFEEVPPQKQCQHVLREGVNSIVLGVRTAVLPLLPMPCLFPVLMTDMQCQGTSACVWLPRGRR